MKSERGSCIKRFLDFSLGIPLTFVAFIFRGLDKLLMRKRETKRVAVLCMGAIGDLLLTSALINSLKFVGFTVDIYTTAGNATAAELIGSASRRYSFRLSGITKMVIKLRKNRYDYLFDTTQWARVGALISAFSGAGQTVGFKTAGQYRSLPYDIRVNHKDDQHEYKNFLALGAMLYPNLERKLSLVVPAMPLEKYHLAQRFIVCHMWATGSNAAERQWGDNNWAELINYAILRGYSVYLTGTAGDKAANDRFIAQFYSGSVRVKNLAGKTTLLELANIMKLSAATVTVNTGPMHLAAIIGARVIALCGPTNPLRWGAVGENAVSLSPKNAKKMLNLGFEKVGDDAMCKHIPAEEVIGYLSKLLNN